MEEIWEEKTEKPIEKPPAVCFDFNLQSVGGSGGS